MLIAFFCLLGGLYVNATIEGKFYCRRNGYFFSSLLIYCLMIVLVGYLKPLGVGYDDLNYFNALVNPSNSYNYEWEWGFVVLYKLLRALNMTEFAFLSATIITISMFNNIRVIKEFSPYVLLSISVYLTHLFFFKELTQFRSAIAYSFCLLSFLHLYRKQHIYFFFFIFIACLFHISAILALVAYFVVRISIKKLYVILLISLICAMLNLWEAMLIKVSSLLLHERAYATYITYAKPVGLMNPVTIKYILLSSLSLYVHPKLSRYNLALADKFEFISKIYIIGPIWITVFATFGTLAGRPASIFTAVECILLAYLCISRSVSNTIFKKVFVILFSLITFSLNLFIFKTINTDLL